MKKKPATHIHKVYVNRCLASYHNLGAFRTITVGKCTCLAIWIFCAIITTPYILYAQTEATFRGTTCRLAWPKHPFNNSFSYLRFWTYFQLVVALLLPSCVILGSYLILYKRLHTIQVV